MSKRARLVACLIGLCAAPPSYAQPAPAAPAVAGKALSFAIYAPNGPFESGTERFTFINKVAAAVKDATGLPAEGKAFAKAADLEAAIKNGQVDFAVLDGVYLAERGAPFQVLAAATVGGETATRWALYSSSGAHMGELQGKKLMIAATGARDTAFIENALLDGEIQLAKFFSGGRSTAPDLAAAVATVTLKKADAVFAPDGLGKGLHKMFDAARVPNAALCATGTADAELIAKVRKAVLEKGAGGGYDGWKGATADAYRTFGNRMAPHSRRPIMAEPEVVRLDDLDLLVVPTSDWAIPDAKGLFLLPPATP